MHSVPRATLILLALFPLTFSPQTPLAAEQGHPRTLMTLTESDLDQVTAGNVLVTSSAYSTAGGSDTLATTSTTTAVTDLGTMEYGSGSASAFACCGTYVYTDATVEASAEGSITGAIQYSAGWTNDIYSQSTAFGFAYAISPGDPI